MFRFEETGYFWLLVILPLVYGLYVYYQSQRRNTINQLGESSVLLQYIFPFRMHYNSKLALLLTAMLFIVLALVNPQFGKKQEKAKTQNIDVFLVLDVSQSMMCADIKPYRLSRAQLWIRQFIEHFPSERIGFISFAGSAYLHAPLTTDLATLYSISSMVSPKSVGTQGTAIADALKLAMKSFAKEEGFHKVIVLISDGEDHEGEALELAKKAKENGITIFTVPVGTEQGGAIPDLSRGEGQFKADAKGQLIVTRPNRQLLKDIAEQTGAEMLEIQTGDGGFDMLKKRFSALARKEITYQSFSSYNSYFQLFLFLAVIVLLIETVWTRKK